MVDVEDLDGKKTTYRAQYLFGADGGKAIGPQLGIEMDGLTKLRQVVPYHFKADLSKYWDDRTLPTPMEVLCTGVDLCPH